VTEDFFLLPIWMPVWFFLILLLALIATFVLFVFFLYIARGPALGFIKSSLTGKIPVMRHRATGEIHIELAKSVEGYLVMRDMLDVAELPIIPEAQLKKYPKLRPFIMRRSYWERLNKPVYEVDDREAIAITPDMLDLIEQSEGNPRSQYPFVGRLLAKVKEGNKPLSLSKANIVTPETVLAVLNAQYPTAGFRAFGKKCVEYGEKSAGFNFGKFALPLGLLVGIAFLFLIVAWIIGILPGARA